MRATVAARAPRPGSASTRASPAAKRGAPLARSVASTSARRSHPAGSSTPSSCASAAPAGASASPVANAASAPRSRRELRGLLPHVGGETPSARSRSRRGRVAEGPDAATCNTRLTRAGRLVEHVDDDTPDVHRRRPAPRARSTHDRPGRSRPRSARGGDPPSRRPAPTRRPGVRGASRRTSRARSGTRDARASRPPPLRPPAPRGCRHRSTRVRAGSRTARWRTTAPLSRTARTPSADSAVQTSAATRLRWSWEPSTAIRSGIAPVLDGSGCSARNCSSRWAATRSTVAVRSTASRPATARRPATAGSSRRRRHCIAKSAGVSATSRPSRPAHQVEPFGADGRGHDGAAVRERLQQLDAGPTAVVHRHHRDPAAPVPRA